MRLSGLVCLLLIPAVPATQMRVDRELGSFRAQDEILYMWSGEHVRRLFPGFENLMADIYWLRTVQYFGGQRVFREGRRFDLLLPLIEITTTLDPRLEVAYRYGAIFLSEPPPGGANNPKVGVGMLERGAKRLPGSWRLWQDWGFFTYFFLKDGKRASEILLEAAEIPGAAYWLRGMAAHMLEGGADREISRRIWREMLDTGEEGAMKINARWNLERLDALDLADSLAKLVRDQTARTGTRPRSLGELQAGTARALPLTPDGKPYDYDPESGRVSIPFGSTYWRPE